MSHTTVHPPSRRAPHPSTGTSVPRPRSGVGILARVAMGGVGVFTAASLIGGALNPGYSLRSDAISSLAAHDADAPLVMVIGFLGLAVGLLATGASLLRSLTGKLAVAGSVLIG